MTAGVWRQLRLLLWKNVLIRRRQKKWLAVELLTPLVLFIILVLIRTRDFSENHPTCHYDAKALPSAGFLPFLQSMLCGMNNTCNQIPTSDDERGIFGNNSRLNQSTLVTFLRQVEQIFFEAGANKSEFEKLARDAVRIVHVIAGLPVSNSNSSGRTQPAAVPIRSFFQPTADPAKLFSEGFPGTANATADGAIMASGSLTGAFFTIAGKHVVKNYDAVMSQDFFTIGAMGDDIVKEAFCDDKTRAATFVLPGNRSAPKELCDFEVFSFGLGLLGVDASNLFDVNGGLAKMVTVFMGRSISREMVAELLALTGSVRRSVDSIPSLTTAFQALNASMSGADTTTPSAALDGSNNTELNLLNDITCGQLQALRSRFASGGKPAGAKDATRTEFQKFLQKVLNTTISPVRRNGTCGHVHLHPDPPGCGMVLGIIAQMRPILMGHILVTPDSPVTRRIVNRLERALRDASHLRNAFGDFVTNAPIYQDALAGSDLNKAMKVVTSAINALNETLGGLPFLPQRVVALISELEHIFEPYTDKRSLLNRINNTLQLTKNYTKKEGLYFNGIVFENITEDSTELEDISVYKIRSDNNLVDGTKEARDSLGSLRPRDNPLMDLKYLTFGFSFLQDAVDRAIIELRTGREVHTGVYAQQTPHPCYVVDNFSRVIPRFVPLFIVLSWVIPAAMIVKNIVHEKEQRLKEVMRVMGLGDAVHWTAWGIQAFMLNFLSLITIVVLLVAGRILPNTSPTVLLVFMTLFIVANIAQCLMLSSFFGKANVATAAAAVIFWFGRVPYVMSRKRFDSFALKLLTCLCSQSAIGWGVEEIGDWEMMGNGAQWSNIAANAHGPQDTSLSVFVVMLTFIGETVLYLLIAWYVSAVFPGAYGIGQPWYFFVKRSYWCEAKGDKGEDKRQSIIANEGEANPSQQAGGDFEPDPTGLPLGVDIRNLKKVYPNGTKAVDNLNMRFYESQITSFLGHNGAGKTTTMSILTGLYPPTSGTALIYGQDIRTDIKEIRKSLGMCPQHNVLFDNLTVSEQLNFYAMLKGLEKADAEKEVAEMIENVGLSDKTEELAQNLSGGMKRKLSIGVAFVGGSRTVILDEPTAGVDPHARRGVWDLLLKYKAGRTIILSTHHMDEADVLGDRIAIITSGRLRTCGSSLFLKTRFGTGYLLTMAKAMSAHSLSTASLPDVVKNTPALGDKSSLAFLPPIHASNSTRALPDSTSVVEFVTSRVPGCQLKEEKKQEVVFTLPLSQNVADLELFFRDLDNNLDNLRISSYGMSATSLEEIFLKVAPMLEEDLKKEHNGCMCLRTIGRRIMRSSSVKAINPNQSEARVPVLNNDLSESSSSEDEAGEGSECNKKPTHSFTKHPPFKRVQKGMPLTTHRAKALLIKRFHTSRRDLKALFCELLLPTILVFITTMALYLIGEWEALENQPPLLLSPFLYSDNEYPNFVFYSVENNATNPSGERYLKALRDPPGIGYKCVPDQWLLHDSDGVVQQCKALNSSWMDPLPTDFDQYNVNESCGCDTENDWTCEQKDYIPTPMSVWDNTSLIIVDMTRRNITQWLVMTYYEMLTDRYGGYSLGSLNEQAKSTTDANITALGVDSISSILSWMASNLTVVVNGSQLNRTDDPFDEDRTVAGVVKSAVRSFDAKDNVKVWFNNKGWASLPAYYNTMSNAMLRAYLPPSDDEGKSAKDVAIAVYNHPMNYTPEQQVLDKRTIERSGQLQLFQAVITILAFSIVPASFVLFLIEERVNHSKHLQFVSGCPISLYWITNFLWDMLNFAVPVILVMLVFWISNSLAYTRTIKEATAMILLLMLYGFAIIPMMYLATFWFSIAPLAFVLLSGGAFFLGVVATIIVTVLQYIIDEGVSLDVDLVVAYHVCRVVFLVLPGYNLGRGLMEMNIANAVFETGKKYLIIAKREDLISELPLPNLFAWEHLGKGYICLLVEGIVAFALVLFIEYRRSQVCCTFKSGARKALEKRRASYADSEDDDVAEERELVNSFGGQVHDDYGLIVRNLSKVYGRRKRFVAVDRISFAVGKGDCFGLLGVNGAGKTTTFKMLTAKIAPTEGDAFFHGRSVKSDLGSIFQMVGYCPQFDSLNKLLTGREQLVHYARIRGMCTEDADKCADWAVRQMNLTPYADEVTQSYSGGNKRKLSTAIALIGDPAVVLLDEPSAGMDASARRFMWNLIDQLRKDNRTIILTSHSMEECEMLCTRIGIMVGGRLKCLGSVQHLKSKFGDGYTLTIKFNTGAVGQMDEACQLVTTELKGCRLIDRHCSTVRYKLPSRGLRLADAFAAVRKVLDRFDVEDFSLSQTTLDEVFVNFASQQEAIVEGEDGNDENAPEDALPDDPLPFTDQVVPLPPIAGSQRSGSIQSHNTSVSGRRRSPSTSSTPSPPAAAAAALAVDDDEMESVVGSEEDDSKQQKMRRTPPSSDVVVLLPSKSSGSTSRRRRAKPVTFPVPMDDEQQSGDELGDSFKLRQHQHQSSNRSGPSPLGEEGGGGAGSSSSDAKVSAKRRPITASTVVIDTSADQSDGVANV